MSITERNKTSMYIALGKFEFEGSISGGLFVNIPRLCEIATERRERSAPTGIERDGLNTQAWLGHHWFCLDIHQDAPQFIRNWFSKSTQLLHTE